MRLSIAMCTYNGARHLAEQLASIAGQTRLPDELVLCDDNSSDATVALVKRFESTVAFPVRLVRNPVNLGYSLNFKQAVQLCSGDVIALADQDDVWYPQKLARLSDVLTDEPEADGVFSDGDIINDDSIPTGRSLWESFRFNPVEAAGRHCQTTVDTLLRRNVVTGMAFAFRRSAVQLLLDMPGNWIHDGWLAMLLAMRSSLFALPERLVAYRVHASQSVGTPLSIREKLVSLRQRGLAGYLKQLREKNLKEYERTAIQFESLAGYLQANSLGNAGTLAKVHAKAAYARRGAKALSLSRAHRWQHVLPYASSYARLSPNGLRGIPRDLIT